MTARPPDRAVRLAIRDDGSGGADPDHASRLVGLRDQVEAIGGRLGSRAPGVTSSGSTSSRGVPSKMSTRSFVTAMLSLRHRVLG
jgi:hypothetical protein